MLTPPVGGVDCGTPINWSHPLNRGRLAWWLCLPGLTGGAKFVDLCKRSDATLKSMGDPNARGGTNGWRPASRPGGWGSLQFDGSAGYALSTNVSSSLFAGDCTLAAWVYVTSQSGVAYVCTKGLAGGLANSAGLFFRNSSNRFEFRVGAGTATSATNSSVISTWQRVVGARRSGVLSIYVNGLFSGSTASSTSDGSSTTAVTIGANSSPLNFWPGYLDDVVLADRGWSAAEVLADYDLSRRGYPGVLRSYPDAPADLAYAGGPRPFAGVSYAGWEPCVWEE